MEKCKISHLKDQKVLGMCVGKVKELVQKMLEVGEGGPTEEETGGKVFGDREQP